MHSIVILLLMLIVMADANGAEHARGRRYSIDPYDSGRSWHGCDSGGRAASRDVERSAARCAALHLHLAIADRRSAAATAWRSTPTLLDGVSRTVDAAGISLRQTIRAGGLRRWSHHHVDLNRWNTAAGRRRRPEFARQRVSETADRRKSSIIRPIPAPIKFLAISTITPRCWNSSTMPRVSAGGKSTCRSQMS